MGNIIENKGKIEETKNRNIGLDCLRIISMIMIVFFTLLGQRWFTKSRKY